jgi:hypothetical protein
MPQDGAAVLLIDYGNGYGFPPHPADFELSQFRHANYECFGDSYTRLRPACRAGSESGTSIKCSIPASSCRMCKSFPKEKPCFAGLL